jgi:hypothetical protein
MATNTIATLDHSATFTRRLEALGISKNFFGELCGVSSGEIASLLNGKKPLGGERIEKFDEMLRDLEQIAELFGPIGVAFRNTQQTLRLIRCFKIADPQHIDDIRSKLDALLEGARRALAGQATTEETDGTTAT